MNFSVVAIHRLLIVVTSVVADRVAECTDLRVVAGASVIVVCVL